MFSIVRSTSSGLGVFAFMVAPMGKNIEIDAQYVQEVIVKILLDRFGDSSVSFPPLLEWEAHYIASQILEHTAQSVQETRHGHIGI